MLSWFAGAKVVVAESYARIFFRNCVATCAPAAVHTNQSAGVLDAIRTDWNAADLLLCCEGQVPWEAHNRGLLLPARARAC